MTTNKLLNTDTNERLEEYGIELREAYLEKDLSDNLINLGYPIKSNIKIYNVQKSINKAMKYTKTDARKAFNKFHTFYDKMEKENK